MIVTDGIILMRTMNWRGHKLKVIRVIHDKDHGKILDAFLDHKHVYILDLATGVIAQDQALIDELDNRYWIPVAERGLDFD